MKAIIPLSQMLQPTAPPSSRPLSMGVGAPGMVSDQQPATADTASVSWSGQRRCAQGMAGRVADRGEAEARLLFARSQISGEPGQAVEAQANVSRLASGRLLGAAPGATA